MTVRKTGGHGWMIGSLLAFAVPLSSTAAHANTHKPSARFHEAEPSHFAHGHSLAAHGGMKSKHRLLSRRGGYGIQCVTFARMETGIQLSGNAANWWDNAAGVYQRGSRPELGSVLNFRANGRMHLGHVAVVTNVVDSRQVDIDQANWPTPGAVHGVARDIRVVDVSDNNDWSAVRVALGHSEEFGSVYPTYGFIYNRADQGQEPRTVVTASAAPLPPLNPPPADLRNRAQRPARAGLGQSVAYDEVAEAPPAGPLHRHPRRHRPHMP